jgi:putative peptide maturation dehydrogenase
VSGLPAPRRYRRCGPVFLECGDQLWLDPLALLSGELTPRRLPLLRVWAPPAARPQLLEPLAAACLAAFPTGSGGVLPERLQTVPGVEAELQQLQALGLIEPVEAVPAPDAALAAAPFDDWFGPAAFYHYASRWQDVVARDEVPVDAAGATRAFVESRAAFEQQTRARGSPPVACPARGDVARALPLPQVAPTAFDALLAARETHRLFDRSAPLPLAPVAQLLARVFGVRGEAPLGGGLSALRKHAPSGGGMHPVEAYPLVVDVEGVAPGWYHYRAGEHRLAPLAALTADAARAAIERYTAGQAYFASAPLVLALTLRFPRHHWKYPGHARAYRVMQLEAGHLGQLFYLAATEAGLGAFFTAAINDADIDAALGLDGVEEGCIAIVGCGRAARDGAALRLSSYVVP